MLARLSRIVIPAQAGIQMIKHLPRSGATPFFIRCAEYIFLLDSGLRRNDRSNGARSC
jgi:hypothetical protein